MKNWNDPDLIKFMRNVTCGGADSNEAKKNDNGRKRQGEDLSVDSYINKYGGIKSVLDDSLHTTKTSYNEHLKANNKIIKDW